MEKASIKTVCSELLAIFFPQRCLHCGQHGACLCPHCTSQLQPIGANRCRRCGKPTVLPVSDCRECRGRRLHFHSAAAAVRYEGPARSLIHGLKFTGQRRLARLMADLSDPLADLTHGNKEVSLTYVPLHRSKQLSRGYNQAGMYAQALSQRFGLPLEELLAKRHPTSSQNQLDFGQRRKNVAGNFKLRRGAYFTGRRVILVDDVYTTGSTASECAKVLRSELKVEVDVWTFARTVRHLAPAAVGKR